MWGNNLRLWFELFAGIVIYRPSTEGGHASDGWINPNDIEARFLKENLLFQGRLYAGTDGDQRNELLNAILNNAGALCAVKLLERRRQISPPSLDYRVTPIGRRVDNWGYGDKPGLRKRVLFFCIEASLRLRRHWRLVVIGTTGWSVLNAIKFYAAAMQWIRDDLFAVVSATFMLVLLWAIHRKLAPD